MRRLFFKKKMEVMGSSKVFFIQGVFEKTFKKERRLEDMEVRVDGVSLCFLIF